MNKRAFTLAEVLLTLAIIGVVAALTIPAVIMRVNNDQYVVTLKKAYNTLKTVEGKAISDHGDMTTWDWGAWGNPAAVFNKYYREYFDILKDCGADTDDGCFAATYPYMKSSFGSANLNRAVYYKFITSDGISYAYYANPAGEATTGYVGFFNVDVNGKKGPNIIGRDLFIFQIYPSLGLRAGGSLKLQDGKLVPLTSAEVEADCSPEGRGDHCAIKILSESAVNY